MMIRARFFGKSHLRLLSILALVIWCVLLVHVYVHYEDDSDDCLLCNSARYLVVSVAPACVVGPVVIIFVSSTTAAQPLAESFFHIGPRSPPQFQKFEL